MTSGDTAVTYTYGADGLRLSKTVDGVTHHYVYSGGKLVEETFGNIEMQFIYDAQGYPMMVCLTRGSEQPLYYHYVVNLQGDVIRILKPNGAVCVTYQYDAWGNITRTGGPDTGLAQWNPLRYRGYIYDTETGLYYLQSRYYNPKVGRFINADGVISGIGGKLNGNNAFAYCFNNPVNMADTSGNWPKWMKTAAKWVIEKAVEPTVSFVKEKLSQVDITYSNGLNLSSSNGIAFNVQGGLSVDTKGNVALQGSVGAGFATGSAGASLTSYQSVSNAPEIDNLNNFGCQVGGSGGFLAGPVPVSVGGDISFIPDPKKNTTYLGYTENKGIGTPGGEFHVELSNTGTWGWTKFNIFDAIEAVCIKIMEW